MTGHTWDEAQHQPVEALVACACGEDGDACMACRDEYTGRLTVSELFGTCQSDGDFGMLDELVSQAFWQAREAALAARSGG